MNNLKPINVLFLINTLSSGGTERQLVELLNSLDQTKIKPYLLYYLDGHYYKNDLHKSISIFYLPKRKNNLLKFQSVVFLINLLKVIYRNKINIVYSFGVGPNFWARIAGKLSRIKVVISFRSTINFSKKELFIEKLFLKWSDKIIVNALQIKKDYLKAVNNYADKNIYTINNGFNFQKINYLNNLSKSQLRKKFGFEDNKYIILNVARVVEDKNQLSLLRAIKRLKDDKNYDFKVIFVGEKFEYFSKLEKYIKDNNLEKYIEFWSEREDVYEIIKASDLLVLSSFREGLSNVVIEAMAIGTLVLTSSFADIDVLIKDQKTGFIYKNNSDEDLARKIIKIKNLSIEKKDIITQEAKSHIKNNFSINKLVEKVTKVFFKV